MWGNIRIEEEGNLLLLPRLGKVYYVFVTSKEGASKMVKIAFQNVWKTLAFKLQQVYCY